MSSFWPSAPDVGPGARATTILTNLQRGNVPTQNISSVRSVDVYQRAGQGDLDNNDIDCWLRETGGDINLPDVHGFTMLMWAAAYGQTPTVQLLLNRGASINCRGLEEETALHLAASCGCIELITLILKHGAFVDTEDENGCTPLMFAAMKNHPHVVNELLAHNADITRRNINDDTAYSLAVRNGARLAQTVIEHSIISVMEKSQF
ncbi:DNA-binding protein RFXANK-like [Eurytemora carolleeae]|uniref:DNA-binding protein RFXANK-like n=1 Tax=Eurytemora carolleeae TaxID=1294199 RepID=UPI000C790275|nr:DNA-binding protein RFXANK-like [Eurytemora carolleeae]|eukprot:XP_023334156.1 DNA-binding protein RFXANK-like [Eurytemora affinis]